MKYKIISALCFTALFTASSQSKPVSGEEKKIFRDSPCIPKASCVSDTRLHEALKEFGFRVKNWQLPAVDRNDFEIVNSSVYAWYETADLAHLEDFAFVQYMRGCVYSSKKNKDGAIVIQHNVMHQSFGKHKLFLHPDWIVDSPLSDPLFGSDPKRVTRHYFMEWNKAPEQFPRSHGTYYGDVAPTTPRLFMFNSPTTPAYVSRGGATDVAINHSLEYRTCLYRTKDISNTSDGSIIPGALGCFEWKSSHVYDHTLRKFASPDGIVDACRPERLPDLSILNEEKK